MKIVKNGLRKEVIKLAAEGLRGRAIANELNKTSKEKISYKAVETFLEKDKKAKKEIMEKEEEFKKESVKYTLNVTKQLYESNLIARQVLFKLMAKGKKGISNKELSMKEKLALIPKYLKSIDDQLKLQAQLLGDINPEGDTTINFNNIYVDFRQIVFKTLKSELPPNMANKVLNKIKEKLEELE